VGHRGAGIVGWQFNRKGWCGMAKISDLVGKTLASIDGMQVGSDSVKFTIKNGTVYIMQHEQNCCESVAIEDVCGDVADLIGSPIIIASEETSDVNPEGVTNDYQDSFTWTFYKLATVKGWVDIRWYGESNGYYSEDVSFYTQAGGPYED
jgi:hypothetical protein